MGIMTGESTATQVSHRVLELLYRYQRVDEALAADKAGETEGDDTPGSAHCPACSEVHQARIERFIEREEPLHFVVPAFPAKSPNQSKVLGALPDLGEQVALGFLQSMCDYVAHFYSPGARVTICSDGHVFGDVVGVSDTAATDYRESLMGMISASHLSSLDMVGLDDAFGSMAYPKMRQKLEEDYSSTLQELKEDVRSNESTRALFNGIHRFMFEDAVARGGGESSRTKLRNDSKDTAYQTILRSNAWSRVVAEMFPEAIRLSIHPQAPHSEKFGLQLMRTRDGWLTPWHGVVLDDGVNRSLVKRWEAEKLQASIVWRDGRPSHFVAPHLAVNS
ncbi:MULTISPECIES: L-tyrosine/L-tryptophan isonitrile synthase family protein [unclassified Streptomyces]|uniref:L-tyrosine/L-tryptophan isonitrile synthase family protein n=1 Tax=unclassified Streptomyces TaxID=2593676 RepID=UPI0038037CAA